MPPTRAARWGPWNLKPETPAEKRRLKILMLHGFGCSPRELRPLGQRFAKRGFEVSAPLLPGHGEAGHGMSACTLEDWTEAVNLSVASLRRDQSPVLLIGHCLGGALALASAPALRPRAVIAIATPLAPFSRTLFQPLEEGQLDAGILARSCQNSVLRQWRERSAHASINSSFLDRMDSAVRAASDSHSETPCPILAVQSPDDPLAEVQVSEIWKDSAVVWGQAASHAPHLESGRSQLAEAMLNFVAQIEGREPKRF